jgi:hypothetical protein
VVFSVHTGDAASRILAVWWKREATCTACRVGKSASLLTASNVFGVAAGDPKNSAHWIVNSNRPRLRRGHWQQKLGEGEIQRIAKGLATDHSRRAHDDKTRVARRLSGHDIARSSSQST